jgi:hypothetical protein
MQRIQSKLGKKTLHTQTREVVNNLHPFMKSEVAAGLVLIPLKKCKKYITEGNRNFRKKFPENSERSFSM